MRLTRDQAIALAGAFRDEDANDCEYQFQRELWPGRYETVEPDVSVDEDLHIAVELFRDEGVNVTVRIAPDGTVREDLTIVVGR